tara:strand:+ start:7533 stop:8102 length:570 start_codon:yes stop_codon:yes gene_type:complete
MKNKTREIILKSPKYGDQIAIIDEDDWPIVSKYKWWAKFNHYKGSDKVYVKAHIDCPRGDRIPRSDRPGQTRKRRKAIFLHRLLMSPPEDMQVDHINGNGLDNRRENLRVCTNAQNNANKPPQKNSKSGLKGVYKNGNRWRARIGHRSRNRKELGYFSTKEEAARAYDQEAIKRYGEFAYTNFLREEYE